VPALEVASPPVELSIVVHPLGPVVAPAVPELKFSANKVGEEPTFEDENRFALPPGQIVAGVALAVTIGAGETIILTAYTVGLEQLLEFNV
jgi:hypothetical protein